jgi:hypothetical protein
MKAVQVMVNGINEAIPPDVGKRLPKEVEWRS